MEDIFKEILRLQQQLTDLELRYWLDHVLFTFNWWFLVFIFIIPWIIWYRLVDKKRIREILLYGFAVIVISCLLDDLGVAILLWAYPYELFELSDRLNAVNLSSLPVLYMLVYQYFPKWKSFFIAHIVLALVFSFVAESILIKMNIYVPLLWKSIYSFPIYITIGVVVKCFTDKISRISRY